MWEAERGARARRAWRRARRGREMKEWRAPGVHSIIARHRPTRRRWPIFRRAPPGDKECSDTAHADTMRRSLTTATTWVLAAAARSAAGPASTSGSGASGGQRFGATAAPLGRSLLTPRRGFAAHPAAAEEAR